MTKQGAGLSGLVAKLRAKRIADELEEQVVERYGLRCGDEGVFYLGADDEYRIVDEIGYQTEDDPARRWHAYGTDTPIARATLGEAAEALARAIARPPSPPISRCTPVPATLPPKDVHEALDRIRKGLRRATGLAWSVTREGGWIFVHAPKARRQGGFPSPADRAELDRVFRDPGCSNSNVGVQISAKDRDTYVARLEAAPDVGAPRPTRKPRRDGGGLRCTRCGRALYGDDGPGFLHATPDGRFDVAADADHKPEPYRDFDEDLEVLRRGGDS